jgi:RNA polymerase-binding transcription factor DksA
MPMMESDSNSIKYWKRSAVTSAMLAFLFLMYSVVNLLIGGTIAHFPSSGNDFELMVYLAIFPVYSVFALVPFVLYLVFGILAIRGNKIGVIGALILSIIFAIGNFVFSGVGIALEPKVFAFFIFFLPFVLLPLFNIYYSLKAIRREVNGTLMSIYRFLACALQQSLGVFVITPWIWFTPPALPAIVSSLLFIRAGEHLFNKEEGMVSKKRIYITNVLSLLIIIVSVWIFMWSPTFSKDTRSLSSIYSSFVLPIIVSSVIVSSCFVAFVPKQLGGGGIDTLYQSTALRRNEESYRVVQQQNSTRALWHERAGGLRKTGEDASGELLLRHEDVSRRRPIIGRPRLEEGGFLYCRYCGRAIPGDSVFCQYCGRRLR